MKKRTTCLVCICIASFILISTILYFMPLPLSNVLDRDAPIYITLIEYNIENGEQLSNATQYHNITAEQHDEILSLFEEYTYQRTFETIFSNGTIQGPGNKVLNIANDNVITVVESGKLAINGKIYIIDKSEQLIQSILDIVK